MESKEKVRQKQELQLPRELNSQGFGKCVFLILIYIPEHLMFVLGSWKLYKKPKAQLKDILSLSWSSAEPIMLPSHVDHNWMYYWSQTSVKMAFFRALHKPLVSFMSFKKSHHMMTNSWLCDEWLSAIKEVASNHRLLARLLGFALSSKVQSKIY